MNKRVASFWTSPTALWLVLAFATLIAFAVCHDLIVHLARSISGPIVVLIAFFKARLIGLHFMDLRHAIWPLRILFEAWIVIMSLALIALLL